MKLRGIFDNESFYNQVMKGEGFEIWVFMTFVPHGNLHRLHLYDYEESFVNYNMAHFLDKSAKNVRSPIKKYFRTFNINFQ